MRKKLFEKKVHLFGEYANKIKMKKCDRLAMKLQVIEGKTKENGISHLFLKSVEFYTTEEVDKFTANAPTRFPNIFKYTSNQDNSSQTLDKACEEWEEMTLRDRWFLMKVIGYFGDENEQNALDGLIKKAPAVSFELLSGVVRSSIEKEEKGFGKKLRDWLNQSQLDGF
jgi:hypothetical protein